MGDLLTLHEDLSSNYLKDHYDEILNIFNGLLRSKNYVTKKQSLKILGELLCKKKNSTIMQKYVDEIENLKKIMNLLRDKSKSIQFEAFQVLKKKKKKKKKKKIESLSGIYFILFFSKGFQGFR